MTDHTNARTDVQQRKRMRQSRDPYRVQAQELCVSVATIAKWKHRAIPADRSSRLERVHKALPPEAAPLLSWLLKDFLLDLDAVWQVSRQTVFPQLSRSAVTARWCGCSRINSRRCCPTPRVGRADLTCSSGELKGSCILILNIVRIRAMIHRV